MPGRSDTPGLLERHGYDYSIVGVEPGVEPEDSGVSFEEVHPGFSSTRLSGAKLWRHQLEALEALLAGENVVLVSGTGSGKTEAWFSYLAWRAARGGDPPVTVAVYPTLALAWDQYARLEEYSRALGFGVVGVDAESKRRGGVRGAVRGARLVATNPAMLFYELKKHLARPGSSVLSPLFDRVELVVLDEVDFYGPRSMHLLLAALDALSALRGGLQVAVLTATLGNPGEMARLLEESTGRPSRVIEGRPFHVENRSIVVLGRGLEGVRRRLLEIASSRRLRLPRDVEEALGDPEAFREKAFMVLEAFAALGVDPPWPGVDVEEILSWYARGLAEPEGVTLVFTRSINEAERIVRGVRERWPEAAGAIASHHHLVPRGERRRVEEAARRGEVRVIVSPRTLAQGIDIGTVVRVVHVGLPESLREYRQREGRKGRRRGLAFTETVIVPWGRWDRELLRRGVSALREWLGLPLEKAWVERGNHYYALFTGAAKLVSPAYRRARGSLTDTEREALEAAGVLRSGVLDEPRLKRLWHNLNFYEYGPPYGVKRVLESRKGRVELEPVGRCDLVEKFQEGCLDPANDAVVVRLVTAGKTGRVVARIVERPLAEALAERDPDWLLEAAEEYRHVRAQWGEEAWPPRDARRGLLSSEAETVVYPPQSGFGLLRKVPYRCVWIAARRRPRIAVLPGGRTIVYRETAAVHVPGRVAGQYADYTYGFLVEAPPGYSPETLRLGLAGLSVYLRLSEGVPLGLLKYSVYSLGGKVIFEVHEEEAAGLLPRLDWGRIAAGARSFEPPGVWDALLLSVDEYAYAHALSLGLDWRGVAEAVAAVAEAIASKTMVLVRLAGARIRVPRPSRSLRLAGVAAFYQPVRVDGLAVEAAVAGAAYYDGEQAMAAVDLHVPGARARPPAGLLEVERRAVEDAEYEGFTIVSFDSASTAHALSMAGLRILPRLVEEGVDVAVEARRHGLPLGDPSWLLDAVEVEGWEPPGRAGTRDLLRAVEELEKEGVKRGRVPPLAARLLEDYLARQAAVILVAHLALEGLAGEGVDSGQA